MDTSQKVVELQRLRAQAAQLESEIATELTQSPSWPPKSYYTTYHILAGMMLGFVGATTSLLFNIVGAAMLGEHPLQLIRVYLTFPLGASALELQSGFVLAAGCCLYLGTGMFGGIPFHMILSRFFDESSASVRFVVATVLAIGVWLINFYVLISWLQPLLIGGSWILQDIPWWVAMCTHLVFGWTLLLVDQWGRFRPPAPIVKERER